MKYVIIGNSAAGIGAVEGIRKIDKDGEITIISNETYHTYSRPLISYLLLGKTTEEKMKYRDEHFYEKNNCKTIFSKTVTDINKDNQTVILDDNSVISYDKLLVATGSIPFVPTMSGLEEVENKFTFMTLDDAKSLEKVITKNSKVLIIGAGLIGLKCAEGICRRFENITVVDLAENILSSILDSEGSNIVKKHLESNDISFKLSQSVKTFTKNTAVLESGEELSFDVLVLAVGVKPNTGLISNIGGDVNRGIVVNEKMETSISNIYAAGDCTESYDISSKQNKVLALLPNAYMGGECAGINMAGGEYVFSKAIPMNAIGFFGLHIITAGSYMGKTFIENEDDKNYKKVYYEDNVLKGYILIGDVNKAGIYTSLIREQTDLSSIDFNLICKSPSLMAFSKEQRDIKLGGAK